LMRVDQRLSEREKTACRNKAQHCTQNQAPNLLASNIQLELSSL
jgi:hypothetical protein